MTGHVNQFENPYSFEAKIAKLPHLLWGPMDTINWFTGGSQPAQNAIAPYPQDEPNFTTYTSNAYNALTPESQRGFNPRGNAQGVTTTPVNWQNAGQVPNPNNQPTTPNTEDMQDQLRNEISSAWDEWISGTEKIGSEFLPQQKTAQEDIAKSQLATGQKTISSQKTSSLRDIASNIRNAFQAGNIYLGARGAGDSSAANQYSFAIQQQAAKQTAQLNEFVDTQMNNLQSQHDQQIAQIGLWFNQAQQQIREQINSGRLSKAQEINNLSMAILNNAMTAAAQVKTDATTRYNALLEWAANNSTNIQQLGANIRGIPQVMGQMQTDSSGNISQQPITGISDIWKKST
ncbi:MAG: hypothetical protein A2163_07840 [Actinobacteria bacterium RBG_13_35_12]|nr:MAG: hypothetical protein A2163_07840 [Actinobacteria bacterium RBG_13_35_12]